MQVFGVTDYQILANINPADLEKRKCRHPFLDQTSLIVLAGHVTLEAGTGCVHTAPGHGREDYEVGLSYGLDAYSPVDDSGRITEDIPEFSGQFVFEADSGIIEHDPLLSPLLAVQKTRDLPGHAPVVYFHGPHRSAAKSPGSH
jgi:isoleucyl-tRNA synthetase